MHGLGSTFGFIVAVFLLCTATTVAETFCESLTLRTRLRSARYTILTKDVVLRQLV
jgi:hypothetical protein